MSDFLFFFFGGGVWKVMLKEKGGSAKIKQAIFHIAPVPPPPPTLSINNDRSLSSHEFKSLNTLVNNQLVCLWPVGILNHMMFDVNY